MQPGQKVQVTEYGGRKLVRLVVAEKGHSIVVCNEVEYARAREEHRLPDGIGFPRESVQAIEPQMARSK
jgi:hypothetical protein